MLLTELKAGDELIIKSYYIDQSVHGDTEVSFHTTGVEVLKNGILTDAMRTDEGNPINFESNKVCSDAYLVREGESPIVWRHILIKRITLKGKRIHGIASSLIGVRFNRRGGYRVPVRTVGVARLGISRKTADVVVRDVSATGFSIVTEKENEVCQYDYVRVTFDDSGLHMALSGICIRYQPIDETRVLYGCQLDCKNPELEEYIALRQRDMAKKNKH